ncbi:MAG: hypothetical protein JXB39_16395, partial [Deltaproteobacteria bacterium]|nr:hypothetical protein [Deltaproteobacteria bacterium]
MTVPSSAPPRLRTLVLVLAPASALVFLLAIFHDPTRVASLYVGRATYGAYQSTLLWYTWFADHLLTPSAWLLDDFQRYPFGVRPIVLWAGDFLSATLFLPFQALPSLVVSTNAFVLALLAANVVATAFVLARRGLFPVHAALLGFLLSSHAFVIEEVRSGRFPQAILFTIPLFLDAWLAWLETGRRRWLVAGAITLGATFHFYPYNGAFAAGAALLLALVQRRPDWRRLAVAVPVVLGGGALLYLPVGLALLSFQGEFGSFDMGHTDYGSVVRSLPENFAPIYAHSVYVPQIPDYLRDPAMAACVVGLCFRGRARLWSAIGLLGLLLALGPWPVIEGDGTQPHVLPWTLPLYWLVRYLPGWSTFSHPVRALVLPAVLGIGVLALGVGWLERRLRTRTARGILTASLALLVAGAVAMRTAHLECSAPPPSFPALARLGDGKSPLVLLPLGLSDQYQYAQIFHGRPTLNANGMFLRHKATREAFEFLLQNSAVQFLRNVQRKSPEPRPFAEADLQILLDQGYREVVYVTAARRRMENAPPEELSKNRGHDALPLQNLRAAFGRPVYTDSQIVVFDLGG